ncbi:hypothetical protein OLMES_3962 [Oleiphilus messinensis]|uniref:Uncharacterized protein n=1 Tax=Oleiphilus messinensis TaxID=141451 RepID=A0A1Y0IBX6_9GAMM|nr:hypothetical protein [Oleiphilus messinensis]ARU57981.1 hypothetical protein OLMES_3962 [Oleiphilus messinensis]
MAWYNSSSLWSVLVATLALVLTQLPPILQWFPEYKLSIQHDNRIGVNNAIGIIGHNLAIELHNKGNRELNVEKIELEIINPDQKKRVLNAESFSPMITGGGQPINLPVNSVKLSPNESSSGFIFFNQTISPDTEEKYNEIRLSISQSIFDKQQLIEWGALNPRASIEASESLVDTAIEFFEEHYDLEKGLHKVTIVVYTQEKAEPFKTHLEYTIYGYHIETVRSQTDDYKYGAGIYGPSANSKQVWLKVRPNNRVN